LEARKKKGNSKAPHVKPRCLAPKIRLTIYLPGHPLVQDSGEIQGKARGAGTNPAPRHFGFVTLSDSVFAELVCDFPADSSADQPLTAAGDSNPARPSP